MITQFILKQLSTRALEALKEKIQSELDHRPIADRRAWRKLRQRKLLRKSSKKLPL